MVALIFVICLPNFFAGSDADGGALGPDYRPNLLLISLLCLVLNIYSRSPQKVRKASAESQLSAAHMLLESLAVEHTAETVSTKRTLEQTLARLSNRQKEMAFLAEIGQLVQACRTIAEVCAVARDRYQKRFPEISGTLSLMGESSDFLEPVVAWGDAANASECFMPDECWALRCGKPRRARGAESPVACPHFDGNGADWHLCLPLIAQNETLGLLYLFGRQDQTAPNSEDWLSESRIHFHTNAAESLALAIANLRLQESLQQQAIRDPITGLFNRRYLLETLQRELYRAGRAEQPLCFAMLDIDHFKKFNDTFGHEAGDAVIKSVGRVLQERIRGGDIACRYGGEEFALVMPGMRADVGVARIESLRQQIETLALSHMGRVLGRITISAGISVFPRHAMDMESLIHAADHALYRSKHKGRNKVSLASATGTHLSFAPDSAEADVLATPLDGVATVPASVE